MWLIDSILNVAALLLWFNWRSMRFDPLMRRKPATLAGTLKSTRTYSASSWVLLGSIPALLIVRAYLYSTIGSAVDWTPRLGISGVVTLAFPADRFVPALVFSLASFARFALVAFFWLLTIVVITRRIQDPDPILRLVRLQLGVIARLPIWVQIIIPLLITVALWISFRLAFQAIGTIPPTHSVSFIFRQACVLILGLVITLRYLLPLVLFLYMISSYIYFGSSPIWDFVSNVSKSLLAPMRLGKMRYEKLDFGPLVAIVLIFLVLYALPELVLRFGGENNLTLWPQ